MTHTRHKVQLAGDTAQTIAKGVNNRICDLNKLFTVYDGKELKKVETPTTSLTINYRSQNNIL